MISRPRTAARSRGVAAAAVSLAMAGATLAFLPAPAAHAATIDIQILATNDFHGRLINEDGTGGTSKGPTAGAAILSGAVKQLRAANPNTLFAAAGDLIGASTFESFIQRDKPTLDALNEAGLDVSAAGNHEFDQGYKDLTDRVMAPYNATTNEYGGAKWQYLAANVRKKSDGSYALPDVVDSPGVSNGATWMKNVAGVDVGFVGAVTEDLPSLVSPDGIKDIDVTNIVAEVNKGADDLKAAGADIVVMLVHEGAATSDLAASTDTSTAFGKIVSGVNSNVNAIVSGHTHLAYNHMIGGRPVVSAGQYGMALNKIDFKVDSTTNAVTAVTSDIVHLKDPAKVNGSCVCTPLFPPDPAVTPIVADAVAKAEVLGAVPLGKLAGPLNLARLSDGKENRGGESTLGNMVAEVQRWATSTPTSGAAQIAFMNPGGLRTDMTGNNAAGYPSVLTYKQAAVVQPFANTLVNMQLTGAQIKTVLEQQWQRDSSGKVPTRPFLRLGTSKGFFYTYNPGAAEGSHVTGMWLNGTKIESTKSYSVTVNSFLASGGDNFRELDKGANKRDTGKTDLQAMVDYLAEFAKNPLAVDYQQHSVGLTWPAGTPRFYRIGERVNFSLSSLAMTAPTDLRDASLKVTLGDKALRSATVNNVIGTQVYDESGLSNVASRLKKNLDVTKDELTLTGATTGSTFTVPIDLRKAKPTMKAKVKPGKVHTSDKVKVKVKVKAEGFKAVHGKVIVKVAGHKYKGMLKKGKLVFKLDPFKKAGKKKIVVKYQGTKATMSVKDVLKIKVKR